MEIELSNDTRETLDQHNLYPLWEIEGDKLGTAKDDLEADSWKWKHIRKAIDQITADVPIEELPPEVRRVMVPVNVAYGGALSHTLFVGIHVVSPGERAAAHRHGGNVLRFTIDGHEQMKSAVGKEEFPMKDNDLVTTPQWEWHEHFNESNEQVSWLEVTDVPLVVDGLNLGNPFEPHDSGRQTFEKPRGFHESQYSDIHPPNENGDIPGPFEGIRKATPPYRFRWTDMSEALEYAVDYNEDAHDPYNGVSMEYTNPARGSGPLFPTFSARAQRLIDGESTKAHRHNATEVYYVVEGNGQTVVENHELDWSKRDIFVVPPYQTHYHNPDGDATFFALTDRPLLEAINFYHEVSEE